MGTRRNNGEGSAPRQRKDGRWVADLLVGWTADGKRQRRYVYGATRKECADNLADLITQHRTTGVTVGKSPTFGQWMQHWLEHIAPTRVRPSTLPSYESKVRVYILSNGISRVRLNKLSVTDLDRLYTLLRRAPTKHDASGRKGPLGETTLLQLHRIIAKALKDAGQRGLITKNPATELDAPTPTSFTPDVFSLDDARKVRAAAERIPDGGGARWLLGLSIGARQGEALALGWDNLDLDAGTYRITRALYRLPWQHGCSPEQPEQPTCGRHNRSCPDRHGGGLHIGEPKSDAGTRSGVLPGPLVDLLRALRRAQGIAAVQDGGTPVWTSQNDVQVDLVFRQRNGHPFDPSRDNAAWYSFIRAAGVPDVRLHDARHTAATLLLLMGVDGRVVMDMMGWSQASMLTRYQHVIDEMKHAAAAKMTSALWADPAPAEPSPEDSNVLSLEAFRRRSGA
ncbi:site-specific integrase [Zhihengliuella sp.]|uniref:tyrosine-type recombinase/integrase n=1 Tax=Zhihengliuella sp. TaxID=1954483 RepID=UPI0028116834|nr:site-specific integrase [Zhihengliuella sp.]